MSRVALPKHRPPLRAALGALAASLALLTAGAVTSAPARAMAIPGHLDRGARLPRDLPSSVPGLEPRPLRAQSRSIVHSAGARRHRRRHRKHRKHHRHRHHRRHRAAGRKTVAAREGAFRVSDLGGWCGGRLRRDDTSSDAFPGQPTVKLIYALPRNRADHFDYWAQILQSNVDVMQKYVAQQSGYRKTVRFDMGTPCGAQWVDIQFLKLRRPTDDYLASDGSGPTVDPGTPLQREVRAATREQHNQNFLVFVDGLNQVAPGDPLWAWGMTDTLVQDDRPGPSNGNNRPGRVSAVFGPDRGLPPKSPTGFNSSMFMHEMLHGLGAVQPSAPNSTGGGHCFTGSDVMCYNDGSARSNRFSYDYCPQVGGEIYEGLDCHNADYFSPNPAPGSYLATHWNVYDSAFLADCTDRRVAHACTPQG
ncbi:MAG: hypothetical protein NVSMB25_07450 [Thermoleophilaceae bacterium]